MAIGVSPDVVVGILDRRGGGRLLRRRPARHARELRPLADQAARLRPSRRFLQRRRADRRRPAARAARTSRSAPCASRICRSAMPASPPKSARATKSGCKRGPLVEAMRASYALPGVFEPVRIGRPLAVRRRHRQSRARQRRARARRRSRHRAQHRRRRIGPRDGDPGRARTEETPIEPPSAEDAAAGVISGLRRGAGLLRRQWTSDGSGAPGLASVMVNAFNITQDRIMRSRLAGDPPDVLVSLKVGKIGLFEFHRADELIALGRRSGAQSARRDRRARRTGVAQRLTPSPRSRQGTRRETLVMRNAFRRVAIYSRSAWRSLSIASTCRLTTSPIETMPTSRPFSTTGRWRKRPLVIISMTWSIDASSVDGADFRRHVPRNRLFEHARAAGVRSRARCRAPIRCRARSIAASDTTTAPTPLDGEQRGDFLQRAMGLGREDVPALFR